METSSKPRLQEKFRAVMRLHHYSIRTEKSYWYWIRYFIRFHKLRHPLELGATEVNAFLTWLAVERQVAAATQNLALNSLVFLYDKVCNNHSGKWVRWCAQNAQRVFLAYLRMRKPRRSLPGSANRISYWLR